MSHNEDFHQYEPNPVLPVERMTGADMSEPLAWLTGQMVDSLVINGHRIVSVDHRHEEHDGRVQVTCSADDGTSVLFAYDPTDRFEPVTHIEYPPTS